MVNSSRVSRWLGPEADFLAEKSRGYRGASIPVIGTPWSVHDGEFVTNRLRNAYNFMRIQLCSQIGGFASLSDLIAEASGGKQQSFNIQKTGVTGVVNSCNTLWFEGALPSAGSAGAALPNGTTCSRTTTGALAQANPTSPDTLHLVSAAFNASVSGNTLLLYDRLWHGAPAMNSSASQTITMTSPRYATSPGSRGVVAWMEVGGTALAATAHTNTITYQDQDGNTAEAGPANTGVSGCIAKRFDHVAGNWFFSLNSGDVGISKLTAYQCSAAVATGVMNLVLARPLAFIPCMLANYTSIMDGINSAFNFVQILDDACLAFVEFMKAATTATTYAGQVILVSG